jgi:ketosteroid isomerase-like protein
VAATVRRAARVAPSSVHLPWLGYWPSVSSSSVESPEQFIRRLYERWTADGIRAAAEDCFDAQIEYHDDAVWPGGGAHRGRSAVISRFEEVIEVLGISEAVVERVIDTGDEVAWVIRVTGRSPGADVPNDHRWGYVGRIAGGRLLCFRAYYEAEEALEAVARQG